MVRPACHIVACMQQYGMEILYTSKFDKWLRKLNDKTAYDAVVARFARISITGDLGDYKVIQGSRLKIIELRIHCSAGYRIYSYRKNNQLIIVLCAGSKDSQKTDITLAEKLCEAYV